LRKAPLCKISRLRPRGQSGRLQASGRPVVLS
jgi:hypothetical protein